MEEKKITKIEMVELLKGLETSRRHKEAFNLSKEVYSDSGEGSWNGVNEIVTHIKKVSDSPEIWETFFDAYFGDGYASNEDNMRGDCDYANENKKIRYIVITENFDESIEKIRRRCRDALNKTANIDSLLYIAEKLNVSLK